MSRRPKVAFIAHCLCGAVLLTCGAKAQVPIDNRHAGSAVTISNVEPRRDLEGNIVDAHDGGMEYFEGRFYLYGTRYDGTDGLGKSNRYVCYSSPDLRQWKFEGLLLPSAPRRTYYRPYVKFNRRTGKYVLWYNAESQYGVATANHPTGPFTIQNSDVALKYSGQGVGDFGLFVDEDGTGYIAYAALNLAEMKSVPTATPKHHRISVERLTPDYLTSTFDNSGFVAGNVESPSLFKRNGSFYLLFDNTCAFCTSGSGVRVYQAGNALGPYAYTGNINLKKHGRAGTSWTVPGNGRANALIQAQQTHIAQIATSSGVLFMWMGDRWGSTTDGIKGHDYQVWLPLEFRANTIRRLRKLDSWSVTLAMQLQNPREAGNP